MNKGIHICIYCGHLKNGPQQPCPHCGQSPANQEERNKSLILSTNYYLPEEDYLGKSDEELIAIGDAIRNGQPHQFADREVRRLNDYAKEVDAITPSQLAREGIIWSSPVLILFIVLGVYFYGKGRWF